MIGYFLLIVCAAALYPNGDSLFYFIVLPVFLAFGACGGAVMGFLVWLPSVVLKRRIGFVARTTITAGTISMLSITLSYQTAEQPTNKLSIAWFVGLTCAFYLPIVLMTGSGIRPCRAMLFGVGQRIPPRTLRGWLAIPPGVPLRAVSIFGMLEALLVLAFWISSHLAPWPVSSPRQGLPATLLAVTYFVTSTYFSLRTPRKIVLLPLAIALNMPAAFLMVSEMRLETPNSDFLAYSYLGFICLWMVYTLGCLLAPTAAAPVAKLVNGTFTLKGCRNATV